MVGGLVGLMWLASVDVTGGATLEAMAGQAPLAYGLRPRDGVAAVLTPNLGVLVHPGRLLDLKLNYGPRLYWRQPNLEARERPLLMHIADGSAELRASPRTTVRTLASFLAGEVDYSALTLVFARTQGVLPPTPSVLRYGGSVDLQHLQTPRLTWGLALAATRMGPSPWWDPPIGPGANGAPGLTPDELRRIFPTLTYFTLTPRAQHQVTRTGSALADVAFSYQVYQGGERLDFVTATPRVGWNHRWAPESSVELSAGMFVARALVQESTDVGPTGNLTWTARLVQREHAILRVTASGGAALYFDQVQALPIQQGYFVSSASLALPPSWTVEGMAYFSTSLRSQPLPGMRDETVAGGRLTARYQLSRNLWVGLAGRYSDRAPHVQAARFRFHQREAWLVAQLIAHFGPGQP